ncbi:hypothetical protein [Planobispora rosea]|uniref:hypothetical protein n=1 Tax=Planobispora rosea TaxID=35762 RepID=UPI00083AA235|nr:hypothetical protein [Planobispora rosea]
MPRLRTTVHVVDTEGRPRAFGPGEDLPDWAATQITNPDVWEGELPPHLGADGTAQERVATRTEDAAQMAEPPRAGKGSGRDAWAAYASHHGVQVNDDDSRDDIITTLTARGLIENS